MTLVLEDTVKTSDQDMNVVIVGHVDHGKSTIIGRLLADTNSLPEGKLEQVKETCRRNSKPFEYAFLLDALKDEQSQGITIDSARCFFQTSRRKYIIIDAPGHVEFLKNMITGASRAEAALLVIDAAEGVQENSRRHGYMLSMLGIKQVTVLVNKMDLVNYQEDKFNQLVKDYQVFLEQIKIKVDSFIPVSGMEGDNIASASRKMKWYSGPTVLEVLDDFTAEKLPEDKPFRMPVQDVYKFTANGDDRRIVAGMIETGTVNVGDELVFYPSGKSSRVKSIEGFNEEAQESAGAGKATGITLTEQIYIRRGELAVRAAETKPRVTSRVKVNLFWLGKENLVTERDYYLKLGTAKVKTKLEKIVRVIDTSDLSQAKEKNYVERHEVAECILKLDRAIAFDLAEDISRTGRFVIVDDYEISGGGIIIEDVADEQSWVRQKVLIRNNKWERGQISREERAEKYNQKASLIIITGQEDVGKKPVAKTLEKRLFIDGKKVYFMGIGNILYGVDADIKGKYNKRTEHLRRFAEVSNLMLDAGLIVIATAIELTGSDLELIKTTVAPEQIETIWVGEKVTTDITYDLHLPLINENEEAALEIKYYLQKKGVLFKPW